MKISKYIIIFFLILSCCMIEHELRVMLILEGYISEYRIICPDKDEITDKKTVNYIKKISSENNVKMLLVEKKDSSLISKEVIYRGNNGAIDDIRNQLGSHKLKLNSFIFPDVKIELELLKNESSIPDYYTLNLSGNTQDIDNVLEQVKGKTGVSYTVSSKNSRNFILIIPWLVSLVIVVFLNIFIFSLTKKETLLHVVFGHSPGKLFLRRFLSDIIIYFIEFLIVFFIIRLITGLYPQIDFMFAMLLLMCAADTLFNLRYFSIYIKNSNKILGNYLDANPLIKQAYIIRFIITTLMIIFISYTTTAIVPFIKYFKAENIIMKYQDYSFSRIAYKHNENESIIELLQNENIAAENIYRNYFNQCDILTLVSYDRIVYSNVNAYSYVASEFDEFERADLQKDLYFLVPDKLSDTQKSEAVELIKNSVACIEGKEFNYTYEVIKYKSGKDIMVFNYDDTGCGFDFIHDPYLVYNTIDFSTLDTDYTSTDRISIAYGSVYHMSEDVVNEIKESYPQIDIKQTNVMELYRRYFSQAKLTMVFQSIASVYFFILLFVIISILVKVTYEVNAKEYALKKVFGYSFRNRFKQILAGTVISDLISVFISRLLIDTFYFNRFDTSINASVFPYNVLWSVSALVMVVNLTILILRIFKFEKENINKILKGGAL